MNYAASHKRVYDALAEEYESRNDALLEVTEGAVNLFAAHLPREASVLELGPGSGLASKLLSEKGFSTTAVELSARMIEKASKMATNTTFIEGNILETGFTKKYEGVFALAFIHLFPKEDALRVLNKCWNHLNENGVLYIGTTKEEASSEGWENKSDYRNQPRRYRKRWTQEEFEEALKEAGFLVIEHKLFSDPFGKTWMDYVAKKVS